MFSLAHNGGEQGHLWACSVWHIKMVDRDKMPSGMFKLNNKFLAENRKDRTF